jgi:uncharacterized protein YcfJ
MNIKKQTAVLIGGVLAATGALAQQHEIVLEPPTYSTQYVYAEVTRVSPVFEYLKRTNTVRECWDEPVANSGHYHGNPVGDTLVGGIIGGAIGHQIGGGHGRDLSTALGTIIGARMGYESAYSGYGDVPQYRRVCDMVDKDNGFEIVQDGYQISYRHEGKDYHTRLPYDPGKRIKLKVQVLEPAS